MKIGYARVSTVDQNTNSQRDALKAAGCGKVVTDQVSGASAKRPKLDKLLSGLQAGDEIVAVDGADTATWNAVNQGLLAYIGESANIPILVKDSSGREYQKQLQVRNWLANSDSPDLLGSLGLHIYRPSIPVVLADVVADSAADNAGLKVGDKVLAAGDKRFDDWSDWVSHVQARPNFTETLEVQRGNQLLALTIAYQPLEQGGKLIGLAGVRPKVPPLSGEHKRVIRYGMLDAVVPAIQETGKTAVFALQSMQKLVMGLISPKNLSGPITIAKVASDSAAAGAEYYLRVLAMLSVMLGVLNLLPIPVLDGGHLLFYSIEALIGRPVPNLVQEYAYRVGFILVMCLMAVALYNDISGLFSS